MVNCLRLKNFLIAERTVLRVLIKTLLATAALSGAGASADAESLRAAVQRALTTNPSIKAVSAEMKASAYELYQTRENYLPTVEVFGELGAQHVNDPAFLPITDNSKTQRRQQVGVNAKLVLFDGYRRANMVYARAARLDGNVFKLLDASETMALNATEAYLDVYRNQRLLAVARSNLERHQDISQRVRSLVDGGRLPYSDLLTAEDRVDAANLAIIDVKRSLRDANARYERVIGNAPSSISGIFAAKVPSSLSQLTQRALSNNFRIHHANTKIDEVRANKQIVLSDNLPEVSLNAGSTYGMNRNGLSGDRSDTYVGLAVKWTVYQGGRKFERNALVQSEYQAGFQRDTVVREVRELAAQSWNNYVTSAERRTQLEQQLEINQLIVGVYATEFDAAKRTLLDLLEVERSRFNVEFQKVSADASLVYSTFRVLATQGTLAEYFGVKRSNIALEPNFRERARTSPSSLIFNTTIGPLE